MNTATIRLFTLPFKNIPLSRFSGSGSGSFLAPPNNFLILIA